MIEALFYTKNNDKSVTCSLCGHGCIIKEGKRGICEVRENINGVLYSLNSDLLISSASDPIEKKPLYHFLPGSTAFSIAAMGCNLKCSFCQNSSISQVSSKEPVEGQKISWSDIILAAKRSNASSIAYTYSEPTVFYEMVKGVGMIARQEGLKNILVTNGFMSDVVAHEMLSFIDGANVDLKFFNNENYKKLTNGDLEKVKSSIEIFAHADSFHLEITTLLIPGINDTVDELVNMASWIASLDINIPWHISRFFPQYKMLDKSSTTKDTLELAYRIGKEQGLKYVYLGNVHDRDREHTYCHKCEKAVIKRTGYWIDDININDGFCKYCGTEVSGVWK